MDLKNSLKIASIALEDVKAHVIGVYKEKGARIELVTEVRDEIHMDTITITELGALQQNLYTPIRHGKLKLFPNNRTMVDMLNDPFALVEFMGEFN